MSAYMMRMDLAGQVPEDEVYDEVARQMYRRLEEHLAEGWEVVDRPVVEETYDFLRDITTLVATVQLRPRRSP